MAKDKDKEKQDKFSFKGADDKAITFQRAVFIVCNLKRLIKRPKKDDKNPASGSRKRSGGPKDDQFEGDACANGHPLGYGQGISAAGLRTPVRRAFTLPTMLCQTLAGGGGQLSGEPDADDDEEGPRAEPPAVVQQHPDGGLFIQEQTIKMHQQQRQHLRPGGARDALATSDEQLRQRPGADQQPVSLSCLATPIRRAARQANRSDDRQAAPAKTPDGCAPPGANQRQLWCPIWALAMELLDRQQEQPRDQTRHLHLIGPPGQVGFVLAPRGEQQRQQSEQTRQQSVHSISQLEHRDVNNNCEPTAKTDAPFRQIPMKRFSSAICLNEDKDGADSPGRRAPAPQQQANQVQRQRQQQQQQQQQAATIKQQLGKLSISSFANQNVEPVQQPKQKSHSRDNASSLVDQQPARRGRRRTSIGDRSNSINVDQQALFSAVECSQLERVRAILESGKANVNSLSGDRLTCLDIAVLMRNADLAQLLQHFGAKESSAYLSAAGRANQLYALYAEARRQVEDLSRSLEAIRVGPGATTSAFSNYAHQQQAGQQQQQQTATGPPQTQSIGSREQSSLAAAAASGARQAPGEPAQLMLATGSLLSSALLEEKQRQLQYWRRRLELFMHMRYEFERLELPNAPELAVLQVTGENSLGIKIIHSLKLTANAPAAIAGQRRSDQERADQAAQLGQLVQLSRARGLVCSLGPKCSHWLISEFSAAHDDQLDCNDAPCPQRVAVHDDSSASGARRERDSQLRRQQHLAVFNHLLAQQLALLSNQQEPDFFPDEQLAARPVSPQAANKSATMNRLKYCHQNESTDTAYDHIGPIISRQTTAATYHAHEGQASAAVEWSPSNPIVSTQASKLRASAAGQQYHSLAYQLMTSRVESSRQHHHRHAQRQHHHFNRLSVKCSKASGASGAAVANKTGEQQLSYAQCCGTQANTAAAAASSAPATAGAKDRRCIITKYKIEWSLDEQFADEQSNDSMIIYNTASLCPIECQIGQLLNGRTYYCQVSAGNHRGFSEPVRTTPVCLAPSSWRQLSAATTPTGAERGPKKAKYDEEVFRKFTKLILLNKHILDENQTSSLQQQLLTGQTNNYLLAQQLSNSQSAGGSNNKSSLINMLLLDATMPSENEALVSAANARLSGTAGGRGSILYLGAGEANAGGSNSLLDQSRQTQLDSQQRETSLKVTRKNLKNFFQSNSTKFHKLTNQNKRGLYLATVIYHSPSRLAAAAAALDQPAQQSGSKQPNPTGERRKLSSDNNSGQREPQGLFKVDQLDKIVVTNDDRLPVIEISNDLVSSTMLTGDFYWLLKINGTQWLDIKRLRQQLQKSHSSSTLHLRIKLLLAIEQMQLALNMEDIGRLFYKPIQAHDGSIVICTCKHLASTKLLGNLSVKWTHYGKIIPRHLRKISSPDSAGAAQDRRAAGEQQQQLARATQQSRKQQQQQDNSTGATNILPATILNALVSLDQQQQQQLSSGAPADQQQSGGATQLLPVAQLPPEAQKLCDSCQARLMQRPMGSGCSSSSTSLASNESLSQWSLSQFSLTATGAANQQQQQQQQTRQQLQSCSCTCSRSNSGCQPTAANQQQQQLQSTGNFAMVASAPGSQRNSTSARSGSFMSGNSGGACALSLGAGSQQPFNYYSNNQHLQQHSASFSAQSGASQGTRQTQSQQLNAPQKSSTYLMLASLSLYELLLYNLKEIIEFDQTSTLPLNRGLYLGFVQLQTTVESMRLLVPRARPNMLPCARIRDNAHVSKEEWARLKKFASEQQQSARSSDPSIWSLGEGAKRSGDQQPTRQQHRAGDLLLVGDNDDLGIRSANSFDRNRAKSMSPSAGNELEQHRRQAQQEARQIGGRASGSESNVVDSSIATTTTTGSNTADSCCWSSSLSSDQITATTTTTNTTDRSDYFGERFVPPDKPLVLTQGDQLHAGNGRGNTYAHSDTDLALARSPQPDQQAPSSRLTASAASTSCSSTSDPNLVASHSASAVHVAATTTTAAAETSESLTSADTVVTDEKPPRRLAADRQRSRSPTGTSRLTVSSLALVASQSPEETFVRLIGSAARRLLDDLKSKLPKSYDERDGQLVSILPSLNDEENNRIYHVELIELSSDITFILLIPAPENVCPVTSHEKSNILADNRDFMLLPLQIFETIHISTYEPDLLGKYSRLSAVLETDLIVAQHDHRQAFSSNELKSTKSRVSRLQDMVSVADEFWRQLRWIVDVVSFARDKSQAASGHSSGIRLATIWSYFDLSPGRSVAQGQSMGSISATRANQMSLAERQDEQQRKLHRGQLEVKRSTSAQTTQSRLRAGKVPEIQLTGTSGQLSEPQAAPNSSPTQTTDMDLDQDETLMERAQRRRHSSDDQGAKPSSIIASRRPKALESGRTDDEKAAAAAAAAVALSPSSVWNVEFGFGPADEDDGEQEAIYAYHISLRDATRAANQRKSSQHSVSVFIDHETLTANRDQSKARPKIRPVGVSEADEEREPICDEAPPRRDNERRQYNAAGVIKEEAETSDSCCSTAGRLAGGEQAAAAANQQRDEDGDKLRKFISQESGGETICSQRRQDATQQERAAAGRANRNLRQSKRTNPFLSDSFD